MKKWYKITFSAQLSEDDLRAMNKCFYDAMEEAMEISPCSNLKIELEENQRLEIEPDLILEIEDLLEYNEKNNRIKVDKNIFDDYIQDAYINIQFINNDEDNKILKYKMISEDDEGIYMEIL